jgi:transcriptional regulator with XRE-family HTH domain
MSIKSRLTRKSMNRLEKIVGAKLTLGKLILAIRQSEELTQVAFAKLLNMSRQQLCDIEHDRKSISPKLATEYAKKLGYSEEQFVRLCLQDMLDRSGLNLSVDIYPKLDDHDMAYA